MTTLNTIRALTAGESIAGDVLPVPGVYDRMGFDEYCAIPALNHSTLKHGFVSARKLKAAIDGELESRETPALSVGSATHTMLSEIDEAGKRFAVEPAGILDGLTTADGKATRSRNSTAYKEARARWEDTLPDGVDVISQDEFDRVAGMIRAIRELPDTNAACALEGRSEVTVRWNVEMGGLVLPMKARIDRLTPGWDGDFRVYDLKTTRRDHPSDWVRYDATSFHYHHQEAIYTAGLKANGIDTSGMVFIVAQSSAPFDVYPVEFGSATRQSARLEAARNLGMVVHGIKTGEWPGVCDGNTWREDLPAWALAGDTQSLEESAA